MKFFKGGILFFVIFLAFGFFFIQSNEVKPKIVFPDDRRWIESADPNYKIFTALLSGDPKLEGLYAVQVKIPRGTKLFPHTHPDSRMVVVLAGKFSFAYGDKFDEAALKEMAPGTFITEPAKQPHFAYAKEEDVILQVTGIGPSGTNFIDQKQK